MPDDLELRALSSVEEVRGFVFHAVQDPDIAHLQEVMGNVLDWRETHVFIDHGEKSGSPLALERIEKIKQFVERSPYREVSFQDLILHLKLYKQKKPSVRLSELIRLLQKKYPGQFAIKKGFKDRRTRSLKKVVTM